LPAIKARVWNNSKALARTHTHIHRRTERRNSKHKSVA